MNNLKKVVEELAACNEMNVIKENAWYGACKGYDLIDLDKQAAEVLKAGYEVLLTFVDGGESEVASLVQQLEVYELNDFLNAVFNDEVSLLR